MIENIARSHINLNTIGACDKISLMENKCHRWYYINIIISEYLSYNKQGRPAIDDAGSRLTEKKYHRRVLSNFQIITPQISKISRI